MFVVRKKRYKKRYLKDYTFISNKPIIMQKKSLIKKSFFELFKKDNFYSLLANKQNNWEIISNSAYLNIAMFKKYKNLLQKNLLTTKKKKLKINNFKKINKLTIAQKTFSKSSPINRFLIYKNYFLIKKKIQIRWITFFSKFFKNPGKKKYKPAFYRFFKYFKTQQFISNNANKKINAKKKKNNIFKKKKAVFINVKKKKLNFDWILVLTTTNTNMYANVTSSRGKTIFYHTLRRVGFQTGGGSKRGSQVAVERLGIFVGKFLKRNKFYKKKFLVIFKGLSWKKRFILKHIKSLAKKIKFVAIFERTGLAHNGCKLKKRKHKRRSFLRLYKLKRKLKIRKFKNIFKEPYTRRKFSLKRFNKNSPLIIFKKNLKLKFFTAPYIYWIKKNPIKKFKLNKAREIFLRLLRRKSRASFLVQQEPNKNSKAINSKKKVRFLRRFRKKKNIVNKNLVFFNTKKKIENKKNVKFTITKKSV